MVIELQITVENADELQAALASLIHHPVTVAKDEGIKKVKVETIVEDEPIKRVTVEKEVKEEPTPTITELRDAVRGVAKKAGGKDAIKALLEKYECSSISDLPETRRYDFLKEVQARCSTQSESTPS